MQDSPLTGTEDMDDHDPTNQASQSHEGDSDNTSEIDDFSEADQGNRDDPADTTDATDDPTTDQGGSDDSGDARGPIQESSGDEDSSGPSSTATRLASAVRDTTHRQPLASRQKAVRVAGGLSAGVILVAAFAAWRISLVRPPIQIDPADWIGLVLVAVSIIWSVSAFFLSRSASREQQQRDHAFQLAKEARDTARQDRQQEREDARARRKEAREKERDQRKEAREREREERRERRAKERARGEIAATIATHVVDINAHLAKIDVLAKPLLGDDEMPDDVGFTIRCPEEIRPIVSIEYR